MSQIKNIVIVLMIAVYLENTFTLGNPLFLKKLQVDRQNRQKDGTARCMKMCPESGELDWLFDWLFFDDDEDCYYMCDITISDALKPSLKVTTTKKSPSKDTSPTKKPSIIDSKGDRTTDKKEDKKSKGTIKDKDKTFDNILTMGNPLVLKRLQVERHYRQVDGTARCMKVCPQSGELDWFLDWFLYNDDDDCNVVCDIKISDDLKSPIKPEPVSFFTSTKISDSDNTDSVLIVDKKTFDRNIHSLPV